MNQERMPGRWNFNPYCESPRKNCQCGRPFRSAEKRGWKKLLAQDEPCAKLVER